MRSAKPVLALATMIEWYGVQAVTEALTRSTILSSPFAPGTQILDDAGVPG